MLTKSDHEVIRKCLNAVAESSLFREQEFKPLFGFDQPYFKNLAASYAEESDVSVHVGFAVHNTLSALLDHPLSKDSDITALVGVSKNEIEKAFYNWRNAHDYT